MSRFTAIVFAALALVAGLAIPPAGATPAPSSPVGLFSDSSADGVRVSPDTKPINLGLKFSSRETGQVTALQFYRSAQQKGSYQAALWDADGTLLAKTAFPAASSAGWQTAQLATPVGLNKGRWYVVSYLATDGRFAYTPNVLTEDLINGLMTGRKWGGNYRHGTSIALPTTSGRGISYMLDVEFRSGTSATTPAPSPSPTASAAPSASPSPTASAAPTAAPSPSASPSPTASAAPTTDPSPAPVPTVDNQGDWPNAANTGVPAGESLTTYTGPLTITTAGTVIRNKTVNGTLRIQAPNVQIVNSRINGVVDLRNPKTTNASFTITDSEVHIGDNLNTGLMRGNFHANRVEITGGRRSAYCQYNCVIENSWVHAQGGDPGGDAHFSGIRMEQNTTVRHNTITCEAQRGSGTGCSAGLTGYGDFAPIQNNLIENNYFHGGGGGGSTICAYGGSSGADGGKPYGHLAANIRFTGNVFAKGASGQCGNLGAIKSFDPNRPGNVWTNNTWDDGTTISHTGR